MKQFVISLTTICISVCLMSCNGESNSHNITSENENLNSIVINFEYGEDISPKNWSNIYAIWIEDSTFIQNIFICKKLNTGKLTGTVLPYWKINKYPSSSESNIDAVTSATKANRDFSISAAIKDSSIREFVLYFEIDRSFEPNDWFEDQPALLYSANINLDDNITEYELSPIGWTPNEQTQNIIPNTPSGQLQKELKYITKQKLGTSFGGDDDRSSTKMVKKITASITVNN